MNIRINKLKNIIKTKNLQAIILTDGYNIHYLSGYKGHCGMMLVLDDNQYILTDSRYTEQVTLEAPDFTCVNIGMDGYSNKIASILKENSNSAKSDCISIGFEDEEISYKQYKAFTNAFDSELKSKYNLVPLGADINALRVIKDSYEIECIAKAENIGDVAFCHILDFIKPGMTEKQVALELEYTMKNMGADGLSFDTIAASGKNSSLPHAVPTDKSLEAGDFLTMDFGCIYNGYCSDMTRTVFIGDNPSAKQELVYNTVLKAQTEALKLIKPGVKCSDVDACARNIIADAGFGDYFGHGLGHSVGLFIHEEPRCSRKCDTILQPGMLMTCEPGIYLPGEFGVRIEDLVVVTEDGYRNLTGSDKKLIAVA